MKEYTLESIPMNVPIRKLNYDIWIVSPENIKLFYILLDFKDRGSYSLFYLRKIEENYNKKEEDFNEKGELNQLIRRLIENCRR